MKDSCYLVITATGIRRMTKGPKVPKLAANERAVRVSVIVDAAAFTPPPVLVASIGIPIEKVVIPPVDVITEPLPVEGPDERIKD